jgi:formate dehydrogenase (NADP+) beta subunit
MDPVAREQDANRKYFVRLPDHDFYEDEVECRKGCPVKTDARGYLIETANGNYREAYRISRETNPFASICGVVCGAPCETECRRADVDQPLAIRNIKGFLTERHGPESGALRTPLTYSIARGNPDPKPNGKRVAVVGGGCAGLTCAHDLARLGYRITVFERHPKLGGQLVQGVPINRLDRRVVQAEIDSILALGLIEVKCGVNVGSDISLEELRRSFDAVFLAVGLMNGKRLPFANTDHPDVVTAMKFLLDFNLYEPWDLKGRKVLVYGGGDTAMDAARSSIRCGAASVQLACMESLHSLELRGRRGREQVCTEDELVGALDEGVVMGGASLPQEIVVENGRLKGLKLKKAGAGPHLRFSKERGRLNPERIEDEFRFIEADLLIWAVRQETDSGPMFDALKLERTRKGGVRVDPRTMMTSAPGIFAGGDIANDGMLFIHAIHEGSRAALGIDAYLTGQPLQKPYREITWRDLDEYDRDSLYLDTDWRNREEEPYDPARPRALQILQYSEAEAREQGSRCLLCHIHPTFRADLCILCGGCVDVCPFYCLRMVDAGEVDGNEDVVAALRMEYGEREHYAGAGSLMLFNPTACVRCGMCAIKCPTGACAMSVNTYHDTYRECGS